MLTLAVLASPFLHQHDIIKLTCWSSFLVVSSICRLGADRSATVVQQNELWPFGLHFDLEVTSVEIKGFIGPVCISARWNLRSLWSHLLWSSAGWFTHRNAHIYTYFRAICFSWKSEGRSRTFMGLRPSVWKSPVFTFCWCSQVVQSMNMQFNSVCVCRRSVCENTHSHTLGSAAGAGCRMWVRVPSSLLIFHQCWHIEVGHRNMEAASRAHFHTCSFLWCHIYFSSISAFWLYLACQKTACVFDKCVTLHLCFHVRNSSISSCM